LKEINEREIVIWGWNFVYFCCWAVFFGDNDGLELLLRFLEVDGDCYNKDNWWDCIVFELSEGFLGIISISSCSKFRWFWWKASEKRLQKKLELSRNNQRFLEYSHWKRLVCWERSV
jgi:hypothetical protein